MVEFRDGTRVAGAFAAGSIAQTSPEPHGLFLEREWELDGTGRIWYELPGTSGLLIPSVDDVRVVRILAREDTGEGDRVAQEGQAGDEEGTDGDGQEGNGDGTRGLANASPNDDAATPDSVDGQARR